MILQELDVNVDRLYQALDDTVLYYRDFPAICRSAIDSSGIVSCLMEYNEYCSSQDRHSIIAISFAIKKWRILGK
ncbi:hypothetical protein M422DRAFT_251177 [Sphaerobolus stellatus SS14]|uniref:Uncharacterized protein n=1 Tax=Sphaerobolus stellatus (strain SS14) TaxID=990650 RepID=A0A0C9VSG9_SPHS4|nr:hypothetical protein M422DRAFT_251177 [Sphaerobolus stellatus SS14]